MQGRTHQEGAALFVSVLILALMGALGIMAFNTVLVDRQVAGFQNRAKTAFYAAEAAAAEARALVRDVDERTDQPTLNPRALGGAALYDREFALPSYSGDPAEPVPIRWVRDSPRPCGGMNYKTGKAGFRDTLWQINVQGQSPDGSTARIEVMQTKCLASGGYY
jgi:hypothetical protein